MCGSQLPTLIQELLDKDGPPHAAIVAAEAINADEFQRSPVTVLMTDASGARGWILASTWVQKGKVWFFLMDGGGNLNASGKVLDPQFHLLPSHHSFLEVNSTEGSQTIIKGLVAGYRSKLIAPSNRGSRLLDLGPRLVAGALITEDVDSEREPKEDRWWTFSDSAHLYGSEHHQFVSHHQVNRRASRAN